MNQPRPHEKSEKTLYRSRSDRMISGVCGGIASYLDVDPTLIRLAAVVLLLVGNAGTLIVYIILAVVVPEEPLATRLEGGVVNDNLNTGEATRVVQPPPPSHPHTGVAAAPAPRRRRSGGGGVAVGVILVLIGVILLANRFVPGLDLLRLWPLIIVVLGIRMMFAGGDES